MSKRTYWAITSLVIAFVFVGALVLFKPPFSEDVDAQLLEQFYRGQYVVSGLIGLLIGALVGSIMPRYTYHRAGERGTDFTGRVVKRGIVTAAGTAALATFVAVASAAAADLDPLAPMDKARLIPQSGLFLVVIAVAFATAALAYAVATRLPKWGGQYALI